MRIVTQGTPIHHREGDPLVEIKLHISPAQLLGLQRLAESMFTKKNPQMAYDAAIVAIGTALAAPGLFKKLARAVVLPGTFIFPVLREKAEDPLNERN